MFEEVAKQIASGSKRIDDESDEIFRLIIRSYGIINEEQNSGSNRMKHEHFELSCWMPKFSGEFNEEQNSFSCEAKQVLYYFDHRRESIKLTAEYRFKILCANPIKNYYRNVEAFHHWKDKFLLSAEFLEEDLNVYLLGLIGSFEGNDHLLAIRDAFDVSN